MNDVVIKKDILERAVNFMPDNEGFCLIIGPHFINVWVFSRRAEIYEEDLENFTEDKKNYNFYFRKEEFLELLSKLGEFVILKAKRRHLSIETYNEGNDESE